MNIVNYAGVIKPRNAPCRHSDARDHLRGRQQGRLFFYRDINQDCTGDVANGSVIGRSGWNQFNFLFSPTT